MSLLVSAVTVTTKEIKANWLIRSLFDRMQRGGRKKKANNVIQI